METKIFDYGMNGEGVGKIDGKIVLVNNTLIDEVAEIDIVEDHKNYAVGTPRKIIKPSCDRQIPPCPYFYECGGCQLQHMNYSEQLKFKTNHIKKTIKKITGLDVNVNDTIPCANMFEYRNKMSFSVAESCCGLLKFNSNSIITVICRNYFNNISANSERATLKIHLVSLILNINELTDNLISILLHTRSKGNHHVFVVHRATQSIDARYTGYNYNILTFYKRCCC